MKYLLRCSLVIALALGFSVSRAARPLNILAATTKTSSKKAAVHARAAKKPSGKKADAKTLVADAHKALAGMLKAARADKGLDPATAKNKPFWKSVKEIEKNLKLADK